MKEKIIIGIKIIIFLCIFAFLFYITNMTLRIKGEQGTTIGEAIYACPDDTVDVLLDGSSHSFANLNSMVMWEDAGVSSCSVGNSDCPYWCAYYFLKEALKTQKPKVIVLEALNSAEPIDYQEWSLANHNVSSVHYDVNKFLMAQASTSRDKVLEMFFSLAFYHSRYQELTSKDLHSYFWNEPNSYYKGHIMYSGTQAFKDPGDISTDKRLAIYPRQEEYLRKILELCKEKRINVLMLKSPTMFRLAEDDEARYNTTGDIAAEYGYPFLNLTLKMDEIGLDYSKDFHDENHTNYIGTEKTTRYLLKYLKENYNLGDHRGDSKYSSWDVALKSYKKWIAEQ
jgi:hypothetical protein